MTKAKETYYKVLNTDGTCFYHSGGGQWHLPKGNRPGKWMPKIKGELRACANGYHILRREDLGYWLGPSIFTVEARGPVQWGDTKGVTAQARLLKRNPHWNEQVYRLWCCDCSEYLADKSLRKDADYQKVILTIRQYAFGLGTAEELERAWAGAWARAWVWARAWAGGAWAWARAAAWAGAAGAGAWAGAAAWAGAWETNRLFDYLDGKVDLEAIRREVEKG